VTAFSTRDISTAVVAAPRADIWALVSDPTTLAELTPLIDSIDQSDDLWTWRLKGISALGVSVAPSFTERMRLVEPASIDFRHDPPTSELAGAHGTYQLTEIDPASTELHIDITLCADLPLPGLARKAVEKVMATMMRRTGDAFAANLYDRLGIPESDRVERRSMPNPRERSA
jgi:carbon monoxide dehydrogenase subunit G